MNNFYFKLSVLDDIFTHQTLNWILSDFTYPNQITLNCLQETNPFTERVYNRNITGFHFYFNSVIILNSVKHLGQSSGNVCAKVRGVEMFFFFIIVFIIAMLIYQVILTINLPVPFLKYVPCQHFVHAISFAHRLF